jgi:hypothetical protein
MTVLSCAAESSVFQGTLSRATPVLAALGATMPADDAAASIAGSSTRNRGGVVGGGGSVGGVNSDGTVRGGIGAGQSVHATLAKTVATRAADGAANNERQLTFSHTYRVSELNQFPYPLAATGRAVLHSTVGGKEGDDTVGDSGDGGGEGKQTESSGEVGNVNDRGLSSNGDSDVDAASIEQRPTTVGSDGSDHSRGSFANGDLFGTHTDTSTLSSLLCVESLGRGTHFAHRPPNWASVTPDDYRVHVTVSDYMQRNFRSTTTHIHTPSTTAATTRATPAASSLSLSSSSSSSMSARPRTSPLAHRGFFATLPYGRSVVAAAAAPTEWLVSATPAAMPVAASPVPASLLTATDVRVTATGAADAPRTRRGSQPRVAARATKTQAQAAAKRRLYRRGSGDSDGARSGAATTAARRQQLRSRGIGGGGGTRSRSRPAGSVPASLYRQYNIAGAVGRRQTAVEAMCSAALVDDDVSRITASLALPALAGGAAAVAFR